MEEQVLKLILTELTGMKEGMLELKSDMKHEVADLKSDVKSMKGNVIKLERNMEESKMKFLMIRTDIKDINSRLANIENDMTEIKGRLEKVEELAGFNFDTSKTIMGVTEEHFKEFKQFIKKNNEDHQKYNSKILNYRVEEDDE